LLKAGDIFLNRRCGPAGAPFDRDFPISTLETDTLTIHRRTLLRSTLALSAAAGAGGLPRAVAAPSAAGFPERPLQWVVAFAPGGAGDIVARRIAREMGPALGQPIVIENRPAPVVGVATVARAKPDGHTLMMVGNGTTLTSALFKSLPYDLVKDFAHVSTLAQFDLALIVDAASPFTSVADVLAFGRAHPGKLNVGSVRVGSTQHLTASMFLAMTGLQATLVPFKTTSDILSSLRNKDLDIAFEIVPPILTQISAKTIRPLATTAAQRSAHLPQLTQVPTLQEAGLAGFDVVSWNGISVPASTPRAVVERLAKAVQAAVAAPDVQNELKALGMEARASSPEEMTRRVQSDIAKWNAVIDKAGIERQKAT